MSKIPRLKLGLKIVVSDKKKVIQAVGLKPRF